MRAYGVWRRAAGSREMLHPKGDINDSLSESIAYYLHMTLPHGFTGFTPGRARVISRVFYLQMSWLILEIACMHSAIQLGKTYRQLPSHGMKQHLGVLDLYVSFFIWSLICFHSPDAILASGLTFELFHQIYYCELSKCKKFGYPDNTILGLTTCDNCDVNSVHLVEQIQTKLFDLYDKIKPLRHLLYGTSPIDSNVEKFFAPERL